MIKKYLLKAVILSLFIPCHIKPQPIKSLKVGNQWFYHVHSYASHVGITYDHILRYKVVKDTLIDNLIYYKIERGISYWKDYHQLPEIFEHADSTKVETIYFTFPYNIKTGQREIAYDFSLAIGDTILNKIHTNYSSEFYTIIGKGDTLLFNQKFNYIKIKGFSFLYNSISPYVKMLILEKIGIVEVERSEADNGGYWKFLGACVDGVVYNDTCFSISWVKDVTFADNIAQQKNPEFIISFTENIDLNSLNNDKIIITGSQTGRKSIQNFNYDQESRSLNLSFDKLVFQGETITITVLNNLKNLNGEKNISPFSRQFIVSASGGTGKFASKQIIQFETHPTDFGIGNFDLDSDLDFIVATSLGIHQVKYNCQTKQYEYGTQRDIVSHIQPIDLDLDGDLDLATMLSRERMLFTFINDEVGSSVFKFNNSRKVDDGDLGLCSFTAFDLILGGYPELITGLKWNRISINVTPDLGEYGYSRWYCDKYIPYSLLCGDFSNDGYPDIIAHDADSSKLIIFPYNYDKNRSGLQPIGIFISDTRYARVVASADIDNDGDLDLVFSSGLVLKNNGRSNFGERTNFQLSGQSLAVGDFDGDTDIDLVASQGTTLFTFLNDGLGNFQQYFALDVPDKIFKILTGDFDNDGDLDILVSYYNLDFIEVFENFDSSVGIKFEGNEIYPSSFHLEQNYPNPFNPETKIKFSLPEPNRVSIKIFNIHGQKIKTLIDKNFQAGYHTISWKGTDDAGNEVTSGTYLYQLKAGDIKATKKMVMLR